MGLGSVISPGIVLLIFALAIPGVGYILKVKGRIIPGMALLGLALSTFFTLNLGGIPMLESIGVTGFEGPLNELRFNNLISIDPFSLVFALIFLAVAMLVVMASMEYIKGQPHEPEFYSLLLLATLGMILVAMANDLIVLFLGLELAGLSTYALAGFGKFTKRSTEAAMKYFIVGAFSSAILIFGISLIYGVAGTTSISELGTSLVHGDFDPVVIVGLIMIIAGLGFKVAAVPFHMWTPDVYQGAPTTVTAFLAAGSKTMGFAAMFKIFLVATIAFKADLSIMIGILAVVTMTVGNLAALRQTDLKRMLAYSSVAQAGYILMAIAIGSQYALAGGIFHIMTHAFMKSGAFIVVAITTFTLIGGKIDDYKSLRARTPITALCMAIFLLSLAGIPPFGGFASKFVLFSSAIDAGSWYVWLAIAAVLNSALSLYYYARVLKRMYVLPDEGEKVKKVKVPRSMLVPMVLAAAAVVVMGLFPELFIDAAMSAARALIP